MLKKTFGREKKRIYLDYAAATPVHKKVFEKMLPYFSKHFGNASAVHREGVIARTAIEAAREQLARILHTRTEHVIFTGSGTESNNLALYGAIDALLETKHSTLKDVELISTKTEHPSVLHVLEDLENKGVTVKYAKLDYVGLIDQKHFESLLSKKTMLVTCAYANSEIGTVQDIKRLTRAVRKYNTEHGTDIQTHLDASQAPLWLSCDMNMLGVDLMTLDAGKCYGPKGVGVLAFRHGTPLHGVVRGGAQEFGLRGGTENTPLIIGCVEALVRAQNSWKERSERVSALRDFMMDRLLEDIAGSVLNGPKEQRIANNVNISVPGLDPEFAVVVLDSKGIAISTRSACSGEDGRGSLVVREITEDEGRSTSTLRFTLGEETTKKELLYSVQCLKEHVAHMQSTIGKR